MATLLRSIVISTAFVVTVSPGVVCQQADPQTKPVGYTDTPKLPNSQWRVHDGTRPQPRKVTPGDTPVAPPSDAVVLFDGTDLSKWKGRDGGAKWRLVDGAMEVNGSGDIETVAQFGDCQLHVEFMTPPNIEGESQGLGNSGVFLMGRYEVQVLDSHKNRTYPDGQAGAIYGQSPPLVNASRPAGVWQSYDIVFEAPRFEGNKLVKPAIVTVFHNGVLVHHRKHILGGTSHRTVAQYAAHPPVGPIKLQDHGNPVRYRNIWVRAMGEYDQQ